MEKEETEMEEALEKNVKCIVIYDSEHQAQGHSGRDSGIPGAQSLIDPDSRPWQEAEYSSS